MSEQQHDPGIAEVIRLHQDTRREQNWKRWGPYLAERQWATVREDYSADGNCWAYFTHDHARSRAYRWGEDGILGICDRECRLCFALAMWNGKDPILKERLFGLSGPEGNHGEDAKECYYYLDSSPTHSYMKGLYKYPQREFPYSKLVEEGWRRGRKQREFELEDSGVFDESRYFDVVAEYAKYSPNDILIKLTVANRGPEPATLHLLPTVWFRNNWSWGCPHEGCELKPIARQTGPGSIELIQMTLGQWRLEAEPLAGGPPQMIFTDNETNCTRMWGTANGGFCKDAFNEYIVNGKTAAVNDAGFGTKAGVLYRLEVPPGKSVTVRLRLFPEDEAPHDPFGPEFESVFKRRILETDEFYDNIISPKLSAEEKRVARQAYAGLLWSKQFYYYVVGDWLKGDPEQPPPADSHKYGRNSDWGHLYNRDVISMPDKWEYPWFAAWDLAFHMLPFARVDPEFAKSQLVLFLREWYMHPNGQLPAYEFAFGDVNPPVHAWACWRVYKMTGRRGKRDRLFLARTFQKLLINFTWWVNRKDLTGKHIFGGGFLGLDNIGLFDRSQPLPRGGHLEQADGTAWMAFYCATMLSMALELASEDPEYEDVASKFFEHFVAITDAINTLGGTGLWDDTDGFYYDQLQIDGKATPLRIRSMVGIIPLFAVEILEHDVINRLPGFKKRMQWFMENRKDLSRFIAYMEGGDTAHGGHHLLAIPSKKKLRRVLGYVLDENEFLSPYGIRSLSKVHESKPYTFNADGQQLKVHYVPGESDTNIFGGNSNWRGPVWFPVNYLLIEALERYHHFYGDDLKVECPTGSGKLKNLRQVAGELSRRLAKLFVPDASGRRPCHGDDPRYAADPHWRELVLFYEHFHGDSGRGLGASHQTGWTALVTRCLDHLARPEGTTARAIKPDSRLARQAFAAYSCLAFRETLCPEPRLSPLVIVPVMLTVFPASADVLILRDGTRLEGEVKRTADGWVITTPDGKTRTVSPEAVKSLQLGSAAARSSQQTAEGLASLRRSVEALSDISQIVERYKRFIDAAKDPSLKEQAQADLAQWIDRRDRKLVKHGSKWVTPEEVAALAQKATERAFEARELIRQNRNRDAEQLLQLALADDPMNPAAQFLRGVALYRQDKIVDARKSFEAVNGVVANHAPTMNNLAVILYRQNAPPAALNWYDQAMQASGVNKYILDNVAEALGSLPEDQQKGPAFAKAQRRFAELDVILQQQLQPQGLFRWGGGWVTQQQMDQLKAVEKEIRDKLAELQKQFDQTKQRITDIDGEVSSNNAAMADIAARSVYYDRDGRPITIRYPTIYYEMQAENDRLRREQETLRTSLKAMQDQAKRVQQQTPVPKFTGVQQIVGVEGMPGFADAPAPAAPAAATMPASPGPVSGDGHPVGASARD